VNQASHQLDLLQRFIGPIDEIFGYWGNLNHPSIEIEDAAIATIRFKNGGMGSIFVGNSQKPGLCGKVHVHDKRGFSVHVQTGGGATLMAGMVKSGNHPRMVCGQFRAKNKSLMRCILQILKPVRRLEPHQSLPFIAKSRFFAGNYRRSRIPGYGLSGTDDCRDFHRYLSLTER
jgi:predicted dehydrogenase